MKRKILNLGCGDKLVDGAVNHDRSAHRPEIDVVWDLNVFPWPWEDASFDLIVARAVFEHLDCDLLASVGESWRILKPAGQLYLKLPYWKHNNSFMDPTHRWFAALETPTIFDPDLPYGKKYKFYTERKWRVIKGPFLNKAKSSVICTLEVRK